MQTSYLKTESVDSSIDNLTETQEAQLETYKHTSERFGLHPIKYGTKAPKDAGWDRYCYEQRAFKCEDFIEKLPNGKVVVLNAGVACGPANGIIVLDVDSIEFEKYCVEKGIETPLPDTLIVASGGKSLHFYFEYPKDGQRYGNKSISGIFDILGAGGQVIAPGSTHNMTHEPYTIVNDGPIAKAPGWLLELSMKSDKESDKPSRTREYAQSQDNAGVIFEGTRNSTLTSLTGKMHASGFSYEAILAALLKENEERCEPPLDQTEVERIVKGITEYPAGKPGSQFHLTDLGNAERLIRMFGDDIRYCLEERRWYAWNGRIWDQRDKSVNIIDYAKRTIGGIFEEAARSQDVGLRKELKRHGFKSEGNSSLKSMVELASADHRVWISPDRFDAQPFLLNALNGTIDLKTGALMPHRREHLLRTMIPVEYDPKADCPEFEKFVFNIMDSRIEMYQYIQKIVGYALTADTSEQIYFVLHGSGSNGKSTLLNVVSKLLGSFAKSISFTTLTYFGDKARTDLARLVGARLVTCSELTQNKPVNEALVNAITGGDPLNARFNYGDEFQFVPMFKLFIAGNKRPNIEGTNYGTWRRIRLIPFEVRFDEKNGRINNYEQLLLQELPGILNWAIEGCMLWQKQGLVQPEQIKQATTEYEAESNVLQTFLDEACSIDPNEKTLTSELYKRFVAWCVSEGQTPLGKREFNKRMQETGFQNKRKGGRDWWFGIGEKVLTDSEALEDLAATEEYEFENLL